MATNLYGKWIQELIERKNLDIHVPDKATRIANRRTDSDNILDYVITKEDQQAHIQVLDKEFTTSDHRPLLITANYPPITSISNYKYALNWDNFTKEVDRPYHPTEDPNYDVAHLTATIQAAILNNTRLIKKRHHKRFNTPAIKNLVEQKKLASHKYDATRSHSDKATINQLVKQLHAEVKKTKEQEKLKKIQNMDDPLKRWQILKHDKPKPPIVPTLIDDTGIRAELKSDKVELLATNLETKFTQFPSKQDNDLTRDIDNYIEDLHRMEPANIPNFTIAELKEEIQHLKSSSAPGHDGISNKHLQHLPDSSLTYLLNIYNTILKNSTYPATWKHAVVTMIHKSGKPKQHPNSYRPISLLPSLGKLLGRLLIKHINKDNIPPHQFGFQAQHSTTHQLIRLVHDIGLTMEGHQKAILVSLDIEAAFDKVPHRELLYKLRKTNQPDWLLKLLQNYYDSRTFQVKLENDISSTKVIRAGTAQGAVISPILYSLYISDMPIEEDIQVYQYADDTAYLASGITSTRASTIMNKQLRRLSTWCSDWKTKINATKSTALLFSTNKLDQPITYNDEEIKPQKHIKYLGVTIDNRLDFHQHVRNILTSVNTKTASLIQYVKVQHIISTKTKSILYNTLIRPTITYGLPAWDNILDSTWRTLENIETKWCRMTLHLPRDTRLEELYDSLPFDTLMKTKNKLLLDFYRTKDNHPNTLLHNIFNFGNKTPLFRARPLIWSAVGYAIEQNKKQPEDNTHQLFYHPDQSSKLRRKQDKKNNLPS
ncbi:RNA-directed DNA polymerase from mobile element jockey [Frankliniella fusca]|uniref:RNA-directed DNA polymerase from mobile element jockey n=1 Tax=Frankliniella fusca TaxID=407009 RepID=A0AAE1HUD8_9NEOP|nr:RNA-directed DNA polymerase from mobile element jockey [Frankliniella fusca]